MERYYTKSLLMQSLLTPYQADLTFHTASTIANADPVDLQDDLTELSGATDLGGAANDLTLPSGQTMIIYITSPDSVTINDIGLTVAITVFTSQAMYYKETNVQAYVQSIINSE